LRDPAARALQLVPAAMSASQACEMRRIFPSLIFGMVSLFAVGAGCTVTTTGAGPAPASDCGVDPSVLGCSGGSVGYSCRGSASPDVDSASLACSVGQPAGGGTILYCCIEYTTSLQACSRDDSVRGCAFGSFGFSCVGQAVPTQTDPSLVCDQGQAANSGATIYCCGLAGAPVGAPGGTPGGNPPPSMGGGLCGEDPSVTGCAVGATAYSCTEDALPSQTVASLVCSDGVPGSVAGTTSFCCLPQTAAGACRADPAIQGCAGNSYGFSCTGPATPDQTYPSLTCGAPTPDASGRALYCCQ